MKRRVMALTERPHRQSATIETKRRWPTGDSLAVCGLLAGAILALGLAPLAMPDSYSWIELGTSESAAQGIDGAWVARTGFILFGLAVIWLVQQRATSWQPLASLLHLIFGVSMFAVAAFSTKPWEDGAEYVASEDTLHSLFASVMGFSFVAALATLIFLRRHRGVTAAIPDWVAFLVTLTVPLAMDTHIWGVLQRVMFLTAALWYGQEAWLTVNAPSSSSEPAGAD